MGTLTRDTLPLSRTKKEHSETTVIACAINCTEPESLLQPLPDRILMLVQDSLSPNNRRAYASDVRRFVEWGGSIPANDVVAAEYIADHAGTHSSSSIVRWLTSLAKAHRAVGASDPTKSELVRSVRRGIRRRHVYRLAQAKPLLPDALFRILDEMDDGIKSVRDRALLLVGFADGFGRSELTGLDFDDVEFVQAGAVISIRKSKTDQFGLGRTLGIPNARGHHCPVFALSDWLLRSGIDAGPTFRPVNRHAQVCAHRLSGEAVSLIIKSRLSMVGIEASKYSGHSLRSGFATSAALAGASIRKIRAQTGQASDAMLSKYIHDAELFADNAAGSIL